MVQKMRKLQVLIVDENTTYRLGVRSIVEGSSEAAIAGEAASAEEALRIIGTATPEVLLLDWQTAHPRLESLFHLVQNSEKQVRLLVCADAANRALIAQALQRGALGLVTKNASPEILLEAIRAVSREELFVFVHTKANHKQLQEGYVDGAGSMEQFRRLTPREREIFHLVARGMLTQEIAEHLYISKRTVENHRSSLMRKLGLRNQVDLVRYATLNGLFEP